MLSKLSEGLGSLLSSIILVMVLPVVQGRSSFDKEDIRFARFNKAATQTSKKALREIFNLLFYRAGVRPVESWSTSVSSFCVNILGWTNRKLRDSFNASERVEIEQPMSAADFDISLLTKLFFKLYEDYRLPESLQRAIRNLKNVRNRVCHDQFSMDETSLRDNMEDLKDMLGDLFDAASSFLDIDLGDKKRLYFDEIIEIHSSPITGQGLSYFENLALFREDLVGKFITHGRKELMSFYAKLKILNPFTWLSDDKFPELLVDKIFTPLYIREQGRAIDMSTLLVTEFFDEVKQVPLGSRPSILILSGVAGCGKTSLCRYILHVWRTRASTINELRSVDILIFIEMRSVSENTLLAYLQKTILRETCSYFDEMEIIPTLQKMNVLFVIDGMDEATENAKTLVEQIFSMLGKARVIISTRPEFASAITMTAIKHHHSHLSLHIKGFTQKGMQSFISSILTCYETDEDKCRRMNVEFTSFLKCIGVAFRDHLKLPLTLALLFILWKDDKSRVSRIKTSTELYSEITRMCIMKLIVRLKPSNSLHHMELESIINDWLRILAEEAFHLLDSGEFVLESSNTLKLTSYCRKHGIDSVQTLSAFLICEITDTVTGINCSFSFMHKSQMEYLASLYLVHRMSQGGDKKVLKSLPMILKDPLMLKLRESRWWNTVLFTLGHMCRERNVCDETLSEIIRILLKPDNHGTSAKGLWRIVQESDCHPLVCELVSSSVNEELIWKPDPESLCDPMHPMTLLLQKTKVTPKGVLIRIFSNIAEETVAVEGTDHETRPNINVFPVLRCLSQRPTTNVCLRLDQHYYEWGNSETSDEVLAELLGGGNLTAFMGHLGVKGAELLSKVKQLGETFVRISDPESLQAFGNSLAESTLKIQVMNLRLDFSYTQSVNSVAMIDRPVWMSIILKGVSDENEAAAADIIIALRKKYEELDLVASNLTPEGGLRFMKRLKESGVQVQRKVNIRTCHRIKRDEYIQLFETVTCKLEWLW